MKTLCMVSGAILFQWKPYTKEEPYIYIFDEKCYCEKERSYQDIHKMWELMH